MKRTDPLVKTAQSKTAFKESGEFITAAYTALKRREESFAKYGIVLGGILVLAAAAYLSMAYNWPKFSRAEVFFAECVREMFEADNLVTPLYHGTPFFDKPILAYWFIALSYKLMGVSHYAARIPSVLSALGTVGLTAFGARHLFGLRTGTLAAAVLASSLMFMSFANLCMADMNLVLFDTMSLTLLFSALKNEKHRSILFYFGALSMGFAFITKGPVGIVLPAISFAIFLTLSKQWNKVEPVRHVLPCAIILAGAGVPWFTAAYRQNGAGALTYFFIHENLERYTGSTYDTHRPIYFMIVSLIGGMLPWSVFIPSALIDSVKEIKAQMNTKLGQASKPLADFVAAFKTEEAQKHVYLWLWTAVVIGFFSLSRGKIDYYALPVYPAVAILIGNYLSKACDLNAKVPQFVAWLASGLLTIAGAALFFLLPGLFPNGSVSDWIALPVVTLVSGLTMLVCAAQKQLRKSFKMLFVAVCLIATAFSWEIYPWISSQQAVLKYVPYISAMPENGRVGVYTSLQNWIDEITFQADCEPMKIENIRMAEQFLKAKAPSVLLIQENEYQQMSKGNSTVLASNPFIPRSLNPVYFLSKGKKIAQTKLLLVTNQKQN